MLIIALEPFEEETKTRGHGGEKDGLQAFYSAFHCR